MMSRFLNNIFQKKIKVYIYIHHWHAWASFVWCCLCQTCMMSLGWNTKRVAGGWHPTYSIKKEGEQKARLYCYYTTTAPGALSKPQTKWQWWLFGPRWLCRPVIMSWPGWYCRFGDAYTASVTRISTLTSSESQTVLTWCELFSESLLYV